MPTKILMKVSSNPVPLKSLWKSQSGSAIVYALLVSVAGIIMVGALSSYYLDLVRAVVRNREVDNLRASLNSAMDYTLNGIRNRWCFSSSWAREASCDLTSQNNVERLLFSDETLRAIQAGTPAAAYGGDISRVRIKSISGRVLWGELTPDHPLYKISDDLRSFGNDFEFIFSIVRMDNGVQKGREVALNVRVELSLGNVAGISIGDNMVLNSIVMVFPRELNTNALVIANNLFLDRRDPGVASAPPGNVYISPQFMFEGTGLRFESPVFVNGNVYVPKSDAPGYTPVTFADKLILGGGNVLESRGDTAVYSAPRSAGGIEDRYYSQSQNFGGFLKGVLLDPGVDAGLHVLAGVNTGTPPDLENSKLCISRNAAKVELSLTRDSQLHMRLNSSGTSEPSASAGTSVNSVYNFTASLGALDNFYLQGVPGSRQFTSYTPDWVRPNLEYTTVSDENRPIMRMTFALNGLTGTPGAFVVVDMGRQSTVKIPMNRSDSSAYIQVTTSPYFYGENNQYNAVNLRVDLHKQEAFDMTPVAVKDGGSNFVTAMEPSIDVNIEAFDVAYVTSGDGQLRIESNRIEDSHPLMGKYKSNSLTFKRTPGGTDKRFVFQRSGAANTYYTCGRFDSSCPVYDPGQAPRDMDFVKFDQECTSPPKGTDMFPSFGSAEWGRTSFTDQTRHSWGFTEPGTSANPGYNPGTLLIDSGIARFEGFLQPTFVVSAIYNTCRIKSDANFVAGFFVCDNLIIESRSEPLRIIGTFIVGHMSIDDAAVRAGVRWSNIFYPTAVYELRRAGILKTSIPGENCDVPTDPIWQPYPSVQRAQFLFKCNPISLRQKADPFRWTTVDPDCGLVDSLQKCLYRVNRYELVELKRQEVL